MTFRVDLSRREALVAGAATLAVPAPAAPAPAWDELARRVGDRLQPVASPLERCVASGGAGADTLFGRTLRNPYAISDDPGLTQTLSWTGAWRTAASARVLAARDARDVAAAVAFARTHGVRLAVRGGGHSYFGNSNAAGSLLVWTHAMRDVVQHAAFVPAGAPAGTAAMPAVTIGAGALWGDIYRRTSVDAGRYVQGGGCLTVGVAGFVLGGGFGSLSKLYGTGAANLMEAEVVTADGRVRVVNRWQDPELFFALRGGGGGSFAVVTRLTLRTDDLPATVGGTIFEVSARDDEAWHALVAATVDHYAGRLFQPAWGEQIRFLPRRRMTVTMLTTRSEAEQRADWAPLLAWMRDQGDRYTLAREPLVLAAPANRFWDPAFLRALPGIVTGDDRADARTTDVYWTSNREEAGQQIYAYKSRWLPRSLLAPARRAAFVDAIVAGARHHGVALHFNKGMAGGTPAAIARVAETAMNPDVLDAFALLIVGSTDDPAWPGIAGHEPDADVAARQRASVDAAFAPLAALTPGAGCYISESDWFDPDWRRAAWGPHYARLLAAKRRYDPTGLFTGHHVVGT